MGYKEELEHFFDLCQGRVSSRFTAREIFYSALTTFKIAEAIAEGNPKDVCLE